MSPCPRPRCYTVLWLWGRRISCAAPCASAERWAVCCGCCSALPGQCPPPKHWTSIFDQLVQPPGVLVCHATSPADCCIKKDTCDHWLVKHEQNLTADIEGPEPPEEKQPALSLLVESIILTTTTNYCSVWCWLLYFGVNILVFWFETVIEGQIWDRIGILSELYM